MLVGIVPGAAPAALDTFAAAGPDAPGAGAFEQALAASVDAPVTAPAATGLAAQLANLLAAQSQWLTTPASATVSSSGEAASAVAEATGPGEPEPESAGPGAARIADADAATAMQMAMGVLLPFPTPLPPLPAERAPAPATAAAGNGSANVAAAPPDSISAAGDARPWAGIAGRSGAATDATPVAINADERDTNAVTSASVRSEAAAPASGAAASAAAASGAADSAATDSGTAPSGAATSGAAATIGGAAAAHAAGAASAIDAHRASRPAADTHGSSQSGNSSAGMTGPSAAPENRRSGRAAETAMSSAGQRLARALGNDAQLTRQVTVAAEPGSDESGAKAAAVIAASVGATAPVQGTPQDAAVPAAAIVDIAAGTPVSTPTPTQDDASGDRQPRDFAQVEIPGGKPSAESMSAPAQAFIVPPATADAQKVVATAQAAPAPAPADVPDPESAAALVDTIRLYAKPGVWEATVTLKPEHMGEVTINLSVERNNVTAVVHAESAGVREWLQSNEGNVRTGLNEQGLQLTRFEVEEQEPQRRRDDQQPRQQPQEQRRRSARRGNTDENRFEITV